MNPISRRIFLKTCLIGAAALGALTLRRDQQPAPASAAPGSVIYLPAVQALPSPSAPNPNPPAQPVRLVFVHHSTGENWLNDDNGGLGLALRDNHYYVSDTNYGWGPVETSLGGNIGTYTDIGHWYNWFLGAQSGEALSALYSHGEQWCGYTRLDTAPPGENRIVLFKSCFPNSAVGGSPSDEATTGPNPLEGQDAWSSELTVGNIKRLYNDLRGYFGAHPEKLFVVVCAPPLEASATDPTQSANARAISTWLVNDWLSGYSGVNVGVFNFYTVLTSNAGSPSQNDLGAAGGNHHRLRSGVVEHITTQGDDVSAYPTADSHPSQAGNLKATGEFLPLLNSFYHRWSGN